MTYYHVTAVDTSGNESVYAAISATRSGAADTTAPSAPNGMTITPSLSGITLDWANNGEIDLAGYNVYRSSSATGTFTKLNSSLIGSSNYFDSSAPVAVPSFYRITAVDTTGNESSAATANATRPSPDTTPPALPTGATSTTGNSGVALNWADNTDSDLGGYNVYRSSTLGGTYTKLNASLLTSSDFLDTTASPNVMNFYHITAVDKTNNETGPLSYSAIGPDTIAPLAPKSPSAVHGSTAIVLDWADSTESDLGGYNVYRSDSATGTFVKLTSVMAKASTFTDSSAPKGVMSYYHITALDKSGNESTAATTSDMRPFSYASTTLGSTLAGSATTVTAGSAYDVSGSGDIGTGKSDSGQFLYRSITGDFDVKVRVASISAVNGVEKAGLMVRESLAADSKMVYAFANSGKKGYRMSYRSEAGADAIGAGSGATSFPNTWLRLKRSGNVFTSYRSADGVNWTKIGTVTITMSATVQFGMAVSSYSPLAVAKASFKNLT